MLRRPKTPAPWIRTILIALALILAVLFLFLFLQYRALRRDQLLGAHEWRWSSFLEHRAPLPPASAVVIRSWMTFGYVNKLFALPPDYLKAALSITDSRYPSLTISEYAEGSSTGTAALLSGVQNAVRGYSASTTPPAGAGANI